MLFVYHYAQYLIKLNKIKLSSKSFFLYPDVTYTGISAVPGQSYMKNRI